MRLGTDVLLQIVEIVREGLVSGSDVSQRLRELDVTVDASTQTVVLTDDYKGSRKGS